MEPDNKTNVTKESFQVDDAWGIQHFLGEQRKLSAVEEFAQLHEAQAFPAKQKYYRDLIPVGEPGRGQQYAFEVDLDSCSGCKACVVACHSLNGLDENESWREVGLLLGGTEAQPALQTVTSACHHCATPGCLEGCPVKAYEKDAVTGIVRHLDDQCIGCQYCILKCPYDVPKYNAKRGIVRKCDMCSSRLKAGEAPACVQACPNQAIKIRIVQREAVLQAAAAGDFLPGAPDPGYTAPSTRYVSKKGLPANMVAGNQAELKPEHAHWPLVVMLVLTQMSVGAFVVAEVIKFVMGSATLDAFRPVFALVALGTAFLALGASTLHLGRPLYAFRAVLGLKTSWMSREILAFGIFSGLASAYALLSLFKPAARATEAWLGAGVALCGLLAVFCSAMIYHDTRRVFWDITLTGPKFFFSMLLLGIPAALVSSLAASALGSESAFSVVMAGWGRLLCGAAISVSCLKMLFESTTFTHLSDLRKSPLRHSALLMTTALKPVTLRRYALGILGGLACPALLLLMPGSQALAWMLVGLTLLLCLGGEIHERYLFFTAVVAPGMPGGMI